MSQQSHSQTDAIKERLIEYGFSIQRAEYFISNLEIQQNGCMVWKAGTHRQGYGYFRVNGKKQLTHRIVAKAVHGDSSKPCVCHTCDNPPCVNPRHLFWGTYSDNIRDMYSKGRSPNSKGIRNYFNKLSESDVNMVRFFCTTKLGVKNIAEVFNVTPGLIYKIRKGDLWKELEYVNPLTDHAAIRIKKYIDVKFGAA